MCTWPAGGVSHLTAVTSTLLGKENLAEDAHAAVTRREQLQDILAKAADLRQTAGGDVGYGSGEIWFTCRSCQWSLGCLQGHHTLDV